MGYNGNHRKPHNVWKPSHFKKGLRMVVPRPRKPRKYVYRQNKTAQTTFTTRTYKLPPTGNETHIDKTKWQNNEKWGCIIVSLVAIAFLALVGVVFGWLWAVAIPIIFIAAFLTQN